MSTALHTKVLEAERSPTSSTTVISQADVQFLRILGKRVRAVREQRGLTRKELARTAAVSERYLGQLESGDGNVSILLLRHISTALQTSLTDLLAFDEDAGDKRRQIALIGLRGAGKTTLGRLLAQDLGASFVELDQEVEKETGLPLSELFTLYGQDGYRRMERCCLERVLQEHEHAVIAVGGGLVSEEDTFNLLLTHCYTIWLKAAPEEHMARVVAQGDLRPMAGNAEAMADLQRLLAAREPLYSKADATVDTSARTLEDSFRALQLCIHATR